MASLQNLQLVRSFFTRAGGLSFRATQVLRAEPPKKKKRADPKQEQMRQQRLLKKLKKIQFKMGDPELKPIVEFNVDRKLMEDERKREELEIDHETSEERARLQKEWSRYKFQQHVRETNILKEAIRSQTKALEELRLESEELYQAAIQRDPNLYPVLITGPTYTPPINDYSAVSPDGDYIDVTKQYK
ncbi:39S ribosomal protein L40, mitochondrial-like [Lytechinus variegatus]|uniref:39S ribosomal protein L40, mitochondrial-like n=1 Tax=Lytechinus variegatus TaxID=7654 RepID=UPI001BB201B4|nr:39S ribosomal protein L40, mitochondrial-like [Lytechinus variegatus]XP_041471281.1 39S ribosomal protein L40, mitochondrial-like [Lytechinus variegatus]